MKKYFNFLLVIVFVAIIQFLSHSCAQIGSISGGDKDTVAPKIRYSVPVFLDTNFNDNKVKFVFDEYVVLKSVNTEFLSSPPFSEKPDIKMVKKKLYVKFNEKLKDSTTYTFHFGNAIEDLNEKNLLENPSFTFSTYNKIDSFSVLGNIKNAFDLKTPENSLVMIYDQQADSIPYLQIPSYICRPDTSGNFKIEFIKQKKYKIFALSDLNGDMIANFGESIAFLDSIIIPEREIIEKIDSFKAGSVLHDITDTTMVDSLVRDTVIITQAYNNYPNNLNLFMFLEDDNYQRINDYDRTNKEKLTLSFDKELTNNYKFTPLNFNFKEDDYLFEKNLTNDSLIYWIKDSSIYNIDSLKFSVTYMSEDSLRQPKLETDTLIFGFKEKENKDNWKIKNEDKAKEVNKIEYLDFNLTLNKNTLDINKNISFIAAKPIQNIDTNNLILYEIKDTSVIDTKKQKIIKAQRINKNKILLSFSRKIVDSVYFRPLNFKHENWAELKKDTSNRNFELNITNEELIGLDTIKFICYYDNDFFLNQIEHLKDTLKLSLVEQSLKYGKREEANKIKLIFKKPVRNFQIIPKNFEGKNNWYSLTSEPFNDTLTINIASNEIIMLDTISLDFKSIDYLKNKSDTSYHLQTANFTFKEDIQFLSSAKRFENKLFKIIFAKKLYGNVEFEALNFTLNNKWYTRSYDSSADTLIFDIKDSFVSDMDSIKLKVSYKNKNRKNEITELSDTILLVNEVNFIIKDIKNTNINNRKNTKEETVQVYLPQNYEIIKDSLQLRKYYIKTDWKKEFKYKVSFDSLTLIDIYNNYNKEYEYEFSVQKEDYYSKLSIDIKNINPLNKKLDSLMIDSLTMDSIKVEINKFEKNEILKLIGDGNFIIQLLDKDNNIVIEKFIKKDKLIELDLLHPLEYSLKIIYDKNNNENWDSGNYFEKKQAERVLFYHEKINLKSGFKTEINWDVGKQLLETFE